MRILVTGAIGFVGTWLGAELHGAGHDVISFPGPEILDIADQPGVLRAIADARPDAIVHLAAMAHPPDASADVSEALRVNVGGTLAVMEACRAEAPRAAILVVGSSEVYQSPGTDAPLTEASPLGPRSAYGMTKLAAEALALARSIDCELEVAVVRSFNHAGPGQRPVFAIPALAGRILEARQAGRHEIRAGNVEVARDFSDVRDVVRAYRLLVEALAEGRVQRSGQRVYNVASGRAVTVRWIIDRMAALADWPVTIIQDAGLVRRDEPMVIRGDTSAIRALTGWEPEIALDRTLADVLQSLQ